MGQGLQEMLGSARSLYDAWQGGGMWHLDASWTCVAQVLNFPMDMYPRGSM